jgi:signal transduction histidine kinase
MYACSFLSTEAPSSERGYPNELPVVIGSVAILTCMASTGLLAHSATIARDKLAEVLYTRRRLWAAIAQKENAEAATAARNEFIASASHEIRTPLHQLQGYADLLSKSELSEEDRQLLIAIQHATRSLAMSEFCNCS